MKSENKDNLKELVDEGTQEKCSIVHSSVSNLNVQLISGKSSDITTRYSYIGISKPGEYPAMTTTPTTGHGLPNSATDPVDLKNVFCLKVGSVITAFISFGETKYYLCFSHPTQKMVPKIK